jgi:hypothetical protein
MSTEERSHEPDLKLAAVCGLLCPACVIYLAERERPKMRAEMAQALNIDEDKVRCDGCRAEVRYAYCEGCHMYACAAERSIEFCGECEEYPCEELRAFQAKYPHRLELWESLDRIREVGYEAWYAEMLERYACSECGTLNSAYNLACRRCSAEPANEYVARHRAKIEAHLKKRQQSS